MSIKINWVCDGIKVKNSTKAHFHINISTPPNTHRKIWIDIYFNFLSSIRNFPFSSYSFITVYRLNLSDSPQFPWKSSNIQQAHSQVSIQEWDCEMIKLNERGKTKEMNEKTLFIINFPSLFFNDINFIRFYFFFFDLTFINKQIENLGWVTTIYNNSKAETK